MTFSRSARFLIAALTASTLVATGVAHASLATEVYLPSATVSTIATFQGGRVAGSTFHATSNITFNSLGFIDVNSNISNFNFFGTPDGLLGSYQVGIWLNSTQTLLASTTVTPASPLASFSQFRYASIPATTILAGEDFTVGALLPDNPLDAWLILPSNTDTVGITGAGNGLFLNGNTLSFPTQSGGNIYAVANASTAAVPEPATAGILLFSGCVALFTRRRATKVIH